MNCSMSGDMDSLSDGFGGFGEWVLAGRRAGAYFTSLGISWADTICHWPFRLSQVSVHVSLTVCFRPSFSVWIALSLPYKMAMASPKKCTLDLEHGAAFLSAFSA
jgi:hypothetical protein